MQLRKYQRDAVESVRTDWKQHQDVIGVAATGAGKAQPLDAQILTPTGFVCMADIRVGDAIIGQDGGKHYVTGVFPQGIK